MRHLAEVLVYAAIFFLLGAGAAVLLGFPHGSGPLPHTPIAPEPEAILPLQEAPQASVNRVLAELPKDEAPEEQTGSVFMEDEFRLAWEAPANAETWAVFAEGFNLADEAPPEFAGIVAALFDVPAVRQEWEYSQLLVARLRSEVSNVEDHPTAHRVEFWHGSPCYCDSHGGVSVAEHEKQGPIIRAWWSSYHRLDAVLSEALDRLKLQETE